MLSTVVPALTANLIEARVNKGALGLKNTPEFRTKRSIVNAKINRTRSKTTSHFYNPITVMHSEA
jgi:hypothetical protein